MRVCAAPIVVLIASLVATAGGLVHTASGQNKGDIRVTASVEGIDAIGRFEPIVLTLSRTLDPDDGHLAVFMGHVDITAMFTPFGRRLRYEPDLIPFASGATELVVFLVTPENGWRALARWHVRVRLPGGFDTASFDPGFTMNNKGQIDEGRFPKPAVSSEHRLYQDFTGQLDGKLNLERGGFAVAANASVVGVSYAKEALRFNDIADKAPKIDLSDYFVGLSKSGLSVGLGGVRHGRHRYLIDNFSSRGLRAEARLGDRLDVSFAAVNGSRIVGWSNPTGLGESANRILSGALGIELLHRTPGALRLEAAYLDGSRLPRAGYNQGAIVDAEKSRGVGGRLLAGTGNRRLRFEAAFAGSRFTNPADPELAQGDDLMASEETTRYAHYVEVFADVLQDAKLAPSLPLNLTTRVRHERVDPLYRTVAAFVRPDMQQQDASVELAVGPVRGRASHSRSEDNLDRIVSILTTKTRKNDLSVTLPIAQVVGASASRLRVAYPMLSYTVGGTHQYGVGVPINGGFNNPHVPDQFSTTHNTEADWSGNGWRLGYRMNYSFQDNRQEGREDADFRNTTHGISVGIKPWRPVDISVDLGVERAENLETESIERTRRIGFRATARPIRTVTVKASISPTRTQDDDLISRRTSNSIALEGSWSFELSSGVRKLVRGQLFVRYSRRESSNRDTSRDLDQEQYNWAVNSGVSLTLF